MGLAMRWRRAKGRERQWGRDNDIDFLLHELHWPPLRFCAKGEQLREREAGLTEAERAVAGYVSGHAGATIHDVGSGVAPEHGLSPQDVKSLLVGLTDRGVLRVCGRVRLEVVDGRYERVVACAVCGSPSRGAETLYWKYGTPVVRCSECGLLYANPRWKADWLFGRYTPDYWQLYAEQIKETALDVQANSARWAPYLGPLDGSRLYNRLLDVGCATGELMLAAKMKGWEVYGVETSPIAASRAAELTGGQVHTGTLFTADFQDGYFDAVVLSDVIEHLQEPRAYVERIARLLRPGGVFTVTTPNIRSVAYRLLGADWSVVGPNDHLYYFAPRTLARLLHECGFSIYVMHTTAAEGATWSQWLRFKLLQPLVPFLRRASLPLTNRLLLGDQLYIVAQLRANT
jgi:2-polyprenyl-3-methyl-5-hydroxy-6-metoxy-1,4-benzoquinol methylase